MKFKDLYEKGLDRKVNPAVSASDRRTKVATLVFGSMAISVLVSLTS